MFRNLENWLTVLYLSSRVSHRLKFEIAVFCCFICSRLKKHRCRRLPGAKCCAFPIRARFMATRYGDDDGRRTAEARQRSSIRSGQTRTRCKRSARSRRCVERPLGVPLAVRSARAGGAGNRSILNWTRSQ